MIIETKASTMEENKKFIEYQKSLICAMFDSGYRTDEIAKQLKIPELIVKLNLGEAEVVS